MNFIQQVYKGNNEPWRWMLTTAIIMAPFLLNFLVYLLFPNEFAALLEGAQNYQGDKNWFLIQNLIPFVFLLGLLFVFVKFLHNRPITSLVTSRKKIDWKRFFFGFFFWGIVSVLFLYIGYLFSPDTLTWNFEASKFIPLLIISLLLIPIQTSLEELLFRGYLMQGLGAWVKNKWCPLIVTSILFGIMHGFNPEVSKMGIDIMVFYIGTGFLFGIITLMDEGTELALGIHAINNIIAAVLVTSNWAAFQTDALFIDFAEPNLLTSAYIPVFLIYPIVLLVLTKKYQWTNWKEKLIGGEKLVILEEKE